MFLTVMLLTMRPLFYAGLLIATVLAAACGYGTEPKRVTLRFRGTVTSADGRPIAGAEVALAQSVFVFTSSAASTSSGSDGRFYIEHTSRCARNSDLYQSPGEAYYLVVRAQGYQEWSSINAGLALLCIDDAQTANFVLQPAR